MDEATRRRREAEIFRAAHDMLARHGYGGASMLRIARAAKASNETLYRWYGDKDGLFEAMVRDNAEQTRRLLAEAIDGEEDPLAALGRIAPVFLGMILGERAVLLNRAAAADPSGALGRAIAAGGRDAVMPLFTRLIARIRAARGLPPDGSAEWFVGLLVGDLQTRRIIHVRAPLGEDEIDARCRGALYALRRLTGV